MKRIIIILFFLSFAAPSLAVTVGGPEISIPEESLYFRDIAVSQALDRYEFSMNVKASVDVEYIIERELTSAPADVSGALLDGHSYMVKFSNNFYNVLEPYVKLGSSELKVQWDQHEKCITVEAGPGFVWATGVKAKIWEFVDHGVKLTLDAQYRNIDLDIDDEGVLIGNDTTETAGATNEDFGIKDWQVSLLASKKFILPVGRKDFYIVPYTGITFSDLDVDVKFNKVDTSLYSTYNASDEDVFGAVFGFDIMPNLWSWYLLNFEARLINEIALSIGGTLKF